MNQLLLESNIKQKENDNNDNDHSLHEYSDEITVKNLRNDMEKKIYYDIYNTADINQKARMHANRSLKAMSFLNNVIG